MTTTAHEDQFTTAPEPVTVTFKVDPRPAFIKPAPVRQPYITEAILRRNVADLEIALRTQTERAEAAEAELAKIRGQTPLAWMTGDGRVASDETKRTSMASASRSSFTIPLFAGVRHD